MESLINKQAEVGQKIVLNPILDEIIQNSLNGKSARGGWGPWRNKSDWTVRSRS
jgi:hypothetical protein